MAGKGHPAPSGTGRKLLSTVPLYFYFFAGLRIFLPAYFPGERRFAGARPTSNGEQPAGDPRVAGGSSGLEPAAIVRGKIGRASCRERRERAGGVGVLDR